ncbi:OprD family porin [Comamonas terrigena]|uniref:OprD family outer membrane porin n=1 Tax=Comamonas terrigena TaxID=32013 RepID=UPI002448D2ED|nr:OprD family outer membrane porin [Comamonas terrigena]MDH1290559.1 OprD family porin [Comamonas terrigena]
MRQPTASHLLSLALLCSTGAACAGAQDDATGFTEGSSLTLLNRMLFEQLDYQKGSSFRAASGVRGQTQAQEAAYGLMLNYQSGYTRGLVGVGLDAHAYGAVNLGTEADSARATPRYVAKDGQDIPDRFGRAGGALKLRVSSTELKLGEMRTKNPIFSSSDTRLLPETNRGWQISSSDIANVTLQAGRFTRWADRNARSNGGQLLANYSGVNGDAFSFLGGAWNTPIPNLSLSSYYGRYEDHWNTWYLGSFYKLPLADQRSLSFNLNVYRSADTGKARAGDIATTTWSLLGSYAFGPHKLGLGYQKVNGDNPFDYVNRGSIWLDNAMQLSDFNGAHEASWQLQYHLDLGSMVTPGLSAGVAYTRGSGVDNRRLNSVYANYLGYTGTGGKHWERDLIVRYTVQQGSAKGLSMQLRYSVHRTNKAQGEANIDQIRLQAEMPVAIFK